MQLSSIMLLKDCLSPAILKYYLCFSLFSTCGRILIKLIIWSQRFCSVKITFLENMLWERYIHKSTMQKIRSRHTFSTQLVPKAYTIRVFKSTQNHLCFSRKSSIVFCWYISCCLPLLMCLSLFVVRIDLLLSITDRHDYCMIYRQLFTYLVGVFT